MTPEDMARIRLTHKLPHLTTQQVAALFGVEVNAINKRVQRGSRLAPQPIGPDREQGKWSVDSVIEILKDI